MFGMIVSCVFGASMGRETQLTRLNCHFNPRVYQPLGQSSQLFVRNPRHRQRKIEGCKVCVLNCGPTGSETIKNLVLAGIASYTLVDNTVVEESDLGNNFLVWFSSNFVFWPVFPCEYYRYSIKNTQES